MSRKKRKFEKNIPDVDKFINGLRYKDLKRECVIRGMEFDGVISGDIPSLSVWLSRNFKATIIYELLDHFDDYQEKLILECVNGRGEGASGLIHPSLRLGYIAERGLDGEVTKRKRVRTIVKKRRLKKERTQDGIFKGTKKALTFELQQQGLSKDLVIEKVLEQFPDASSKSVGIWFNRSRKAHGTQ